MENSLYIQLFQVDIRRVFCLFTRASIYSLTSIAIQYLPHIFSILFVSTIFPWYFCSFSTPFFYPAPPCYFYDFSGQFRDISLVFPALILMLSLQGFSALFPRVGSAEHSIRVTTRWIINRKKYFWSDFLKGHKYL